MTRQQPTSFPVPTDNEAHQLLSAYDQADEGQQKQIATTLGRYSDAKKAQGLRPF